MALLGTAAIVIWSEMPPTALEEHDHWHSVEHFPERLAIPGFLRGRRCAAEAGTAESRFVLYELQDIAVATSAAYLKRLNNPTPWSQSLFQKQRLTRALCRVVASHGEGLGGALVTLRFSPHPEQAAGLGRWFADLLPQLPGKRGIVGAHLLQRDAAVVRPTTAEEKLRHGGADGSADWVLVLEGHDPDAVSEAIGADDLLGSGAEPRPVMGRYRLSHTMSARK